MNKRTHPWTSILLSVCVLISLVLASVAVQAQIPQEAIRLQEQGITANSNELRLYYRQQLAAKYPSTAYGQFALGALASANGDRQAAIKHYREAIKLEPQLPAALNNLSIQLESDDPEAADLRALAARIATEKSDYFEEYYVRNDIEQILQRSNWSDSKKKQYMRDRLQEVRNEAHQIAYNHMLALKEPDTKRALALMEKASQFGYSPDSLDTELRLRVKFAQENRGDINAIFGSLNEVVRKVVAQGGTKKFGAPMMERLYLRLTEYAFDFTTSGPFLMDLATRTYNIQRSPAVIDELYRAHLYADMGDFEPYLNRWNESHPENAQVQRYASMWNAYHAKDFNAAMTAADKAVSLSPTDKLRDDAIFQLLVRAIEFGQIDQGLAKIQQHDKDSLTTTLVDSQVLLLSLSQNFDAAQKLINRADSQNVQSSRIYRVLVEQGLQDQRSRQEAERNNPFLSRWDREFGSSLSLGIEFALNSATIPASAQPDLNKAGRALTQDGAKPYIFRIEGHTDSTGSNRINMPLSGKRAASVKNYLLENFNIEPGRLQTAGVGDMQPVASNLTEQGRQRNRRVEVLPYGNVQDPTLSTVGYLDSRSTVFSKDGRYAAAGEFPIALWDLKQGVRLRELYIGGSQRSFSPNSRYLAALSNSTDVRGVTTPALYVTDIKTGLFKLIIPFVSGQNGGDLAWSPDGTRLVLLTNNGTLMVVDVAKGHVVAATPVGDKRITGRIVWAKNGHAIFVAQAQAREVFVFDPETLERLATIDGVNWAHGMGESDDGKVLIVANNDRSISLIDTQNFRLIEKIPNPVPTPENIIAIAGTTKVLMDDKFQDNSFSVLDYQTKKIQSSARFADTTRVGISPDGAEGYAAIGKTMGVIDLASLTYSPRIESSANPTRRSLTRDSGSDYLFISDSEGASIWHITQARMVHRIDEPGALTWKQSPVDESLWWSVSDAGELLSFSTADFIVKRHAKLNFEPGALVVSKDHIAVSEARQAKARSGKLAVFEIDPVKLKFEQTINLITEPLRYGGGIIEAGIDSMLIDEQSGRLGVTTWWNNGNYLKTSSRNIQIFDLKSGQPAGKDIVTRRPVQAMYANHAEDKHYILDSFFKYPVNLAQASYDRGTLRDWNVTDLGEGQEITWGTFFLQNGNIKRHVKDGIAALIGDAARNLIITVSEGNKLTYYDFKTLEPRFSVQIKSDGQWLATNNQGYFTSSIRGTEGAFWNLGDNYLPFEALKDKYENDRAVRQTLVQLFEGKSEDDTRPVFDPEVIEMPFKVTLTSQRDVTTRDEQYKITLTIEKENKNVEDPQLYFRVNGRRSRGFDQDPFADLDEKLTFIRTVPLGVGENIIEAVVNHKGVDVHKEVVTVKREQDKKVALQDKTLWFFGVGVSEYENNLQNLDFADRDAIELEKMFLAQKGKLFTDVKTRVLTNRDATAREVKIELHEFFADAKPSDEIVIFLAGHGVQDRSQALYFMPHDGDMSRPFTGMPMDDFRLFLEQRPLNQKALFLLDICHAGAFDNTRAGRVTAEDVIKELSSGTATTVFSSSTGAQQSLEDERFGGGHGAFTYSLLKGMRGEADRETGDLDGINSLLEVIVYSRREVPRLTNQAQSPTVPVMSSFEDYPLSSSIN